jgi:hypothetical protein
MNIPLMLSNTGSVRLAAHPTRSDANEIVIGDGQASVTLATNVLDSVALLFARAYDTAHKASSMRGELTDIMRDPTTPEQLRSRISGLLHGLYGDSQVACSAHGQYHPCGKCAEEHRKNKPVLACLAHPAETLPCPACATPGKTQKDLETCAREQGWRPVSELPPLAITNLLMTTYLALPMPLLYSKTKRRQLIMTYRISLKRFNPLVHTKNTWN